MQFQFRLTPREFADSLKLNQTAVPMQWKTFAFVIICLTPSLLIAMLMTAKLTTYWFFLAITVMVVYAISAFFRQTGKIESYDQAVELTDEICDLRFSDSHSQIKWKLIDEIRETPDAFLLRRLQRFTMIPKRALGEQVQPCRDLFERVKTSPPSELRPLGLYAELFESDSPFAVHRFFYHDDDLKKAVRSTFRPATDPQQPIRTKQPGRVGWIWLLVFMVVLGVVLGLMPKIRDGAVPFFDLILLTLVWILPVVIVWAYTKFARRIRSAKPGEVPKEQCESRLTQTGWAVGNPEAVTLFDWNDIHGLFESPDFIGFKTVNQLLHLIPKRIFQNPGEAEKFVAQAMELKHQSRREQQVPTAVVVETGNPYQPPGG